VRVDVDGALAAMADHHRGRVTPQDIRAALEDAVIRGGNRELLERQHQELVAELGSEEKLAERWSMLNSWEAFREQVRPSD
jgi:hypothetical protein